MEQDWRKRRDEELVLAAASDPEAFAAFYRRHSRAAAAFFLARTGSAEVAADLMAETFAAALAAAPRYRVRHAPVGAWLYAIARHKLSDSRRRGQVEANARRRLKLEPVVFTDDDLERVESLADLAHGPSALHLLEDLPAPQREAVKARILDEREYPEIARDLGCSEFVVRKRVSRALASLRTALKEEAAND